MLRVINVIFAILLTNWSLGGDIVSPGVWENKKIKNDHPV